MRKNKQDDRFNVRIRNIRGHVDYDEQGLLLKTIGDLWLELKSGTTMIASGSMDFLYDLCNKNNYKLLGYVESVSANTSRKEFNDFQRQYKGL